jgi:hypothetical protein
MSTFIASKLAGLSGSLILPLADLREFADQHSFLSDSKK